MHHALRLGALLALMLCFTGCSVLYGGYSIKPVNADTVTPYVQLTDALKSTKNGAALVDASCFATTFPSNGLTADTCTSQRNQAIAALIIGSDNACMAHRRSMYGNEAAWNIALGTFTNLFAGAASVISAERSKSILAALALFTNSERSLVNETVYKQMLVTAVDKKIVEARDTKTLALYSAMKQNNIAAYSVHEALRDVLSLHNSCSFIDGLEKALREGTQDMSAVKIVRLRTNLQSLVAERMTLVVNASTQEQANGLDARIKAANVALQAEEIR
jgi:hypothetical protein